MPLSLTNCGLLLTRSLYPICATCPRSRNHSALVRFCSDVVVSSFISPLPLPLLLPLCYFLLLPSVTSYYNPLSFLVLLRLCYFLLLPLCHILCHIPSVTSCYFPLSLPITTPCHFSCYFLYATSCYFPYATSSVISLLLLPVTSLCHFLLLPPANFCVTSPLTIP
jgi:hypothetical protein